MKQCNKKKQTGISSLLNVPSGQLCHYQSLATQYTNGLTKEDRGKLFKLLSENLELISILMTEMKCTCLPFFHALQNSLLLLLPDDR